jgi:fructokinase
MRKIYCIGETVYDIIFKNSQPVAAKAGGSMLNSTVSLGRVKMPVHFISEYATDDIGNQIDDFLKYNHVNTNYVYRFKNGKTSIAIAFLNKQNDARYTFYKELPENRLDINFPDPKPDDIILFGSFYAINKEIRKSLYEFISKANKNGALIIYDPNFRKAHFHELNDLKPFIIENLQIASIVRASNEDLQMIFNTSNLNDAYNITSKYCKILIYTENANGAYVITPNFNIKEKVQQITPISTIGAGDNFNSGIIFGLINHTIYTNDLQTLSENIWHKLLQSGINFASDVCMSYDNYISEPFAKSLIEQN